jgi:hypothetical protein
MRLSRDIRLVAALAGFVLPALLTACTFDQQSVGVPASQIVVQAVLSLGRCQQKVLVERTLSGTIDLSHASRYDLNDPVRTGGGQPVSGATLSVTRSDGRQLIGAEAAQQAGGFGAGLYLLTEARCTTNPVIIGGGLYTLSVKTPDGHVVTGTTRMPDAPAVLPTSRLALFDRDRDTLRLGWTPARFARTYGLRVDTPHGPFFLFSDSTRYTLAGGLRNFFAANLERVFVPGFQQNVLVFASDTNYFDYYRSRNDPFTGSGIINRLSGGIGLFGSVVVIDERRLDVTQGPRDPSIEGEYVLREGDPGASAATSRLRIYVESPGEPAALSGWYTSLSIAGAREGFIGTRAGARVTLRLVVNQSAADAVDTFTAEQRGDSLVGTFASGSGRVVYVRQR